MSGWTKERAQQLEDEIAGIEMAMAAAQSVHTAAASIENIDRQLEYWRKRLALASYQERHGEEAEKKRATATVRLASDQLLDWEKRRSVAMKSLEVDKVDAVNARLDEMERASGMLRQIAT